MEDIASQLRTARTNAGIDIATAEYATKIRSKYLRALESGDWAALPEETAAKSFLRTYGDYLGLDGRALVDVFKAGRVSVGEPSDYAPKTSGGDGGRRSWRTWLVVVLVLILIVGLFLIGTNSDASEAAAFINGSAGRSAL
ncbi:MAG: helix-turn-helix domain-containing protein [Solirubrobacteraceae bacterium]|jgi:cytoskeletal protein RodZ|nr:helix-turn-helix domain-containing protein [Solirubrobacteraceae bacterium]MDP4672959.1 helix-turn-helix domain-containing protein [Solirubrobacteraceae bacterium]MDP4920858.1 helix-turn-helix domain-containing protein [Solirubrobacteraceae bacterium]